MCTRRVGRRRLGATSRRSRASERRSSPSTGRRRPARLSLTRPSCSPALATASCCSTLAAWAQRRPGHGLSAGTARRTCRRSGCRSPVAGRRGRGRVEPRRRGLGVAVRRVRGPRAHPAGVLLADLPRHGCADVRLPAAHAPSSCRRRGPSPRAAPRRREGRGGAVRGTVHPIGIPGVGRPVGRAGRRSHRGVGLPAGRVAAPSDRVLRRRPRSATSGRPFGEGGEAPGPRGAPWALQRVDAGAGTFALVPARPAATAQLVGRRAGADVGKQGVAAVGTSGQAAPRQRSIIHVASLFRVLSRAQCRRSRRPSAWRGPFAPGHGGSGAPSTTLWDFRMNVATRPCTSS